jgi:energy-coupling factor transport system ATP-binding protein
MISFENVAFTYTGESFVLKDISLEIPQGQFLCVLGANGSGKSTFSKLVNALLLPDEGKVVVNGLDTHNPENTFAIRSNAGSVFQNPDDQIVASLVENDVAFGPENLGIPNPELRKRVETALAQVGLQGYENRETTALSGGQKQRVAIAGVLAMEPQILIFAGVGLCVCAKNYMRKA